MPKHKKDKHAKSLTKRHRKEQDGVPPTVNGQDLAAGDSKTFQQQDAPLRRMGDFEGTAHHARTGNRGQR